MNKHKIDSLLPKLDLLVNCVQDKSLALKESNKDDSSLLKQLGGSQNKLESRKVEIKSDKMYRTNSTHMRAIDARFAKIDWLDRLKVKLEDLQKVQDQKLREIEQ